MLTQAFHHTFPAPIWRLVCEQAPAEDGLLLAEIRTGGMLPDERTLRLETLGLPHGEPGWLGENALPWSATVLQIWYGLALYHRFDNARLPVPTALGCLDLRSGEVRWEWPGHALVRTDGRWVAVRRTADPAAQPVVFRLADGEAVQEPVPEPSESAALHFPVSYPPDSPHRPVIDRYLRNTAGIEPIGPVGYLEIGDKLLFSYTVDEGSDSFRSYVRVADRRRQLWLQLPIGREPMAQPPPDSVILSQLGETAAFFVWQRQLVLQTQPTELVSFYL